MKFLNMSRFFGSVQGGNTCRDTDATISTALSSPGLAGWQVFRFPGIQVFTQRAPSLPPPDFLQIYGPHGSS